MIENSDSISLISPIPAPNAQNIDADSDSLQSQISLRYKKDTEWRINLVKWVMLVDSIWLGAILLIVALNSYLIHLKDSVLITLLATTTVNVLGLAFIILKGMFYSGQQNKHNPR